jgi:hypothetical protein
MPDIRRTAACLVLTACLAASSGLAAASALASAAAGAAPAANGSYSSWRSAQHAAGFSLVSPRRTYGLKRVAPITVQRCAASRKSRKQSVSVTYGSATGRLIAFAQNDAGRPCGKAESGKPLGTLRVHGITAHLAGMCGVHGLPSCSSRNIFLLLTWRRHGIYVQVVSHDERRGTLAGFARGLKRVG